MKKITCLLVKPMQYPQIIELNNTLDNLQKIVDGDIETIYPFDDEVALLTNDEGKIKHLVLNRPLKDENGKIYDIIAGDFLVIGLTKDDFGSLSKKLLKKYIQEFNQPYVFTKDKITEKLLCIPINLGYETNYFLQKQTDELER